MMQRKGLGRIMPISQFEETFAVISNDGPSIPNVKAYAFISKQQQHKDKRKAEEHVRGDAYLEDGFKAPNVDGLSSFPREWSEYLVPKDSPKAKEVSNDS